MNLLPPETANYWRHVAIWDREVIEEKELGNRAVHIHQRARTVAEVAAVHRNELAVLDLCCGTGKIALEVAMLPNVQSVTAVDISGRALALLAARASSSSAQLKLQLCCGDAALLPLRPDGEFEAVLLVDCLHHLSDPPTALAGVAAVLKPNGMLVGNWLSREHIARHISRKRGPLQHLLRTALARSLFRVRGITRLWQWAGSRGFVRLAAATEAEVRATVGSYFTLERMESDDYHWFRARRRTAKHVE